MNFADKENLEKLTLKAQRTAGGWAILLGLEGVAPFFYFLQKKESFKHAQPANFTFGTTQDLEVSKLAEKFYRFYEHNKRVRELSYLANFHKALQGEKTEHQLAVPWKGTWQGLSWLSKSMIVSHHVWNSLDLGIIEADLMLELKNEMYLILKEESQLSIQQEENSECVRFCYQLWPQIWQQNSLALHPYRQHFRNCNYCQNISEKFLTFFNLDLLTYANNMGQIFLQSQRELLSPKNEQAWKEIYFEFEEFMGNRLWWSAS